MVGQRLVSICPIAGPRRSQRLIDNIFRIYSTTPSIKAIAEVASALLRIVEIWLSLRMSWTEIRGKPARSTISDNAAPCPLHHVNRQFKAPRPNALWVFDFTYVATTSGFAYVAFIIDAYARRIVGWRVLRTGQMGFVLDALKLRRPRRTVGQFDRLARVCRRGIESQKRLSDAAMM